MYRVAQKNWRIYVRVITEKGGKLVHTFDEVMRRTKMRQFFWATLYILSHQPAKADSERIRYRYFVFI